MKLHLGKNFSLDREALRQVWSILAVRGAGKSYLASVVIEEILERQMCPVVVLDPMDGFWGLKSSADGKHAGYPVIVMGGTHADVPLEPTAGTLVADFFVEHRQSLILVFAHGDQRWPKAQQVRFVADFGARLYERNAGQLMLLVVDEADIFANQRPGKDELRCLGVMEDIGKRGRKPGIFPVFITQRSSNLNKNVLDETEMLVALRTTSPRDQDALESWFRHLPREQQERKETLLRTWAKLPNGTAWFWCPPMDLFQQVEIRERRTFDSSATPKFGEKPREPKVVAPVDLEKLKTRMAQTIERAKQEDPKALHAEIARLRHELSGQLKAKASIVSEAMSAKQPKVVKVPVVLDKDLRRLEKMLNQIITRVLSLRGIEDTVGKSCRHVLAALEQVREGRGRAVTVPGPLRAVASPGGFTASPPRLTIVPKDRLKESRTLSQEVRHITTGNESVRLGIGEKKVLAAVAQYPEGVTREQLTVLTGYRRSSRDTYLQRLRAAGWVHIGARVFATPEGIAALGNNYEPLPTGQALRDYWLRELPAGERKILEVLLRVYPNDIDREALSEETGYQRSSRDTYLQRLRARELVVANGRGPVKASAGLFE